MSRDAFARQLPKFTNNALPVKPPFMFNGMSTRVFPLRANLDALQHLCDGYLNIVPPEAGYFRASVPYVYLMVLDYGQIAEAVVQVGWFAQLEVFFSVPVEWYKLVNGRWVFHDWAVFTPYVFVNDTFSVPLGRTVYGFPKVLATMVATESQWVSDPVAPVTVARIETQVFPETYSDSGLEKRVFLDVERTPTSNLRIPFDPSDPAMPWTIASNLADAIGGFGRDAMWMMQAMRISPVNPAAYPWIFPQMLDRLPPVFAPGGKGFVQTSLNLKQFRRADDPQHICYQSLTSGQMVTTAINGAGLLGENRTVLGDLSGGYNIKLLERTSLPIERTLGLEVALRVNLGGSDVAVLKPVLPFWFNADLRYEHGNNVAWRSHDGVWKDESGQPFDPAQKPATTKSDRPEFNCMISTAIEAISGPFQYSDTTVRVLPLLAKRNKLQKFLDDSLNHPLGSPVLKSPCENSGRAPLADARGSARCSLDRESNGTPTVREGSTSAFAQTPHTDGKPEQVRIVPEGGTAEEHVRFSVWAHPPARSSLRDPVESDTAYVYLTATSFGGVKSKTNNVGNWAKYELSFLIPVYWERLVEGQWTIIGVGVVPAYSFVDDCIAAISRIEVQGLDVMTANFVRPESVWLSPEGELSADPQQTLLRVEAEVFVGAAQKSSVQPVIDISRGAVDAGLGNAPDSPWHWAEQLRDELGAKKATKLDFPDDLRVARALALEFLGNQTPVSIYTLKQFRDVADADKACYQSLVRVPRALNEILDVREIEDTLVVKIHDYPALSIVETLGLASVPLPDEPKGIVHSVQAIRPFYIRATLTEPLAERLLARCGGTEWTLSPATFQTMLSNEKGSPVIMADLKAEMLQDQMDPSRTAAIMYQARLRYGPDNPDGISADQAVKAVARVDPQMVIESVLSREWTNNDPNAYWRKGQQELLKGFSALPQEGVIKPFAEAETSREFNNALALHPGAVASKMNDEEIAPVVPYTDRAPDTAATVALTANAPRSTAAARWRAQLAEIIERRRAFSEQQLRLEQSVDILAPVAILGLPRLESALNQMQQPTLSTDPLGAAFTEFMDSLQKIQELHIAGEPSETNNLDTVVLATNLRLGELLAILRGLLVPGDPPGANMERVMGAGELYRQAVDLARQYCGDQQQALLNKLSRAYQKPDYCIRRDAVGSGKDRWLPLAYSWNDDWYYGMKF